MKKTDLIVKSFINSAGVLIYITMVTALLAKAKDIFVQENETLIPIFMLLLLVISASITGFLVLGRPILLYIDKQRKEAFYMLFATIGWLVVFLGIVAFALLIR